MATLTNGVATASTTDGQAFTSGSFTPAANDFLHAYITISGNTDSNPYMTDTQNLGWDLVTTALYNTSGNKIYVFAAKKLAANSSMTVTFNVTNGSNATGCVIQVCRASGMTLLGAPAFKQNATVANHASGSAPAPAFGASVLTGDPTSGVVGNLTNPAGLTAPTSWTSQSNTGYATPTTGAEYVTRNSGFTGTTITWGSSSATAFGSIITELWVNANPAVPTLSSPSNAGTVSTLTPNLDFSTTDPDSDTIRYELELDTVNTFNSQTAVTGAAKFTASSGYLINTSVISSQMTSISFFTWLKLGATGTNFMIWRNGIDTSFGQGYGFYISGTDGTLNIDVSFVANLQAANLAITDTNEHFVGFVVDANNNWQIFLDGKWQSVGHSVPFATDTSSATIINAEYNGSGTVVLNTVDATFEGTGYWERRITQTEISNMYNSRIAPNKLLSTSNLVGFWKYLSGAFGTNSGTGANLTANGTIAVATSGFDSPLVDALSGTNAGFSDLTTPADTDPFPSGDSMQYAVQSALTNSTTYYWRVRAIDPSGSALWSSWSSTFSFTVSTGGGTTPKTTLALMGVG